MDKFLLGFFSFGWLRGLDFLAPLALRLYLAPMFWVAGASKLGLFTSTDFIWYNPFTWINMDAVQTASSQFSATVFSDFAANFVTVSIAGVEVMGALLLMLGFAVRWITLPLLFIVGMVAYATLGELSLLKVGEQFLATHGYTTIASNAIEVTIVHLLMLFSLFFMGAGRFLSLDWFIYHSFNKKIHAEPVLSMTDDDDLFDIDATHTDKDFKV